MIRLLIIEEAVHNIRKTNKTAKIYLYTAYPVGLEDVLHLLDGVTLTIHEDKDWQLYDEFEANIRRKHIDIFGKSLKLCIFDGISYHPVNLNWKIKENIKWLDDCPLPKNEDFLRYQG